MSVGAAEHRALSAHAFVDSVGVNTHSSYVNTAYARLDRILWALGQIHVQHIRDGLLPLSANAGTRAWEMFYYRQLAARGIRADLGLGNPQSGESSIDGRIRELDELPRGFVEFVEGPNEYDLAGEKDWVGQLDSYQQRVFATVRATPSLRGVPVIGPSFGNISNSPLAGDLSPWSDIANIHPYPGGLPPPAGLTTNLALAHQAWGSERVVATETGYHNALRDRWGQPPVSERAAAAYVPRLFLEDFMSGIVRTYAYELVDEWPDPLGLNAEAHFGLFRNDFSPKPAAIALGHLLALLEDPRPPTGPTQLSYTLTGNVAGVEHLLLKRANGSFALILWQDVSVWDRVTRTDLYPPGRHLRLRLASPARIKTTRLLASGRPTVVRDAARAKITVPADDTLVVLIRPSGRRTVRGERRLRQQWNRSSARSP